MANLRWLWSHARRAKLLLLLSTVLMAAEAFFNLVSVQLQMNMIDDVLVGGRGERFWPILLQIAGAYLLYSLLFTFGPHMIHLTFARMRSSMGGELMRKMHRVPVARLQSERTAGYAYHFSNDLESTANMASGDLPRLLQQFVTAGMVVTVIASASPLLLAVMIVSVALYTALGRWFGPARKRAAAEISRHRSELLVHMEEGVSATREVVAFHRQEWENRIYRSKIRKVYDSIMKEGKLVNKQLLLSDPLKWGTLLFVLLFCGTQVLDGRLSLGLFVVTYQYANRFMESLAGIYQFVMELSGKMAAADRVRKVLNGPELEDGTRDCPATIGTIAFRDVVFAYDKQTVLNGLDLTIPAGRKTAFVGASGGGKSTIASLLVRFFEPASGDVLIDGVKLRDIRRSSWMSRVTLVFQEPYMLPDTIRTNLLLGLESVTEERMIEVCRAMRLDEFIRGLPDGYDTVIGERGVTLSGGQRQRLALARAVLRDTDVLILDEATSSLDLETERQVQEQLDRLRQGRITIVIAHRLSTVENADLIFVMNRGEVAEQGTHEQLLRNQSVYADLVRKQREEQSA